MCHLHCSPNSFPFVLLCNIIIQVQKLVCFIILTSLCLEMHTYSGSTTRCFTFVSQVTFIHILLNSKMANLKSKQHKIKCMLSLKIIGKLQLVQNPYSNWFYLSKENLLKSLHLEKETSSQQSRVPHHIFLVALKLITWFLHFSFLLQKISVGQSSEQIFITIFTFARVSDNFPVTTAFLF